MKKFIIILILVVLLMTGCALDVSQSNDNNILPINSTNFVNKGNGWITFEFEGNRFLYHKEIQCGGHRGYEAITQIVER